MTVLRPLRQGLPRVPGGEPWPPAGVVEVEDRPDYLAETAGLAAAPAGDLDPAETTASVEVVSSVAQSSASTVANAAPVVTREERRVPLRRGLPRIPAGEPWPPEGFGVLTVSSDGFDLSVVASQPAGSEAVPPSTVASQRSGSEAQHAATVVPVAAPTPAVPATVPPTAVTAPAAPEAVSATAAPATVSGPVAGTAGAPALAASATEVRRVPLRRGLPRVAGGEPWPAAGDGVLTVSVDEFDLNTTAEVAPPAPSQPAATEPAVAASTTIERVPLRRGLPRTAGGEPWPAAGFGVLSVPVVQEEPTPPTTTADRLESAASETPTVAPTAPTALDDDRDIPAASVSTAVAATDQAAVPAPAASPTQAARPTSPVDPTPAAGASPTARPTAPGARPAPAARPTTPPARPAARPAARSAAKPATGTSAERQPFNLAAFFTKVVEAVRFPALALVGAIAVVGGLFMLVRWMMGTDALAEFLVRYPGEYPLPEGAEPGFPAWVRWNHFLNMFFIILIIRSGLQNRYEKKPPAYWTPRWSGFGGGKKISISLWLHQMLDILWLLNGIVFITLLFVTGHWMRIVPTSWTVFPNALSAMLQYLSLDWPTENGWVAYNSLQQLTYFTIVFIAAPLAAVTGLRMSGLWPAKAQRLSTLYPVELARAVHFPTMLFFVFFVITHVAMVFATGALRNLNHMFAGTDSTNWAGFWIFVIALAAIATLWELARPMILAPIASLLGQVTQR